VVVVGVAADSKYRTLNEAPLSHLYLAADQHYEPLVTLHLRTNEGYSVVAPLLRAEAQRLDAALPLYNVRPLTSHLGFATLLPRFSASALSAFGGLALAVAALGIYSMVAFWVAARRRELGIRLAVGASPGAVLMLVIRNGLGLTGVGIVMGLALAVILTRFISGLLVDVKPIEPLTFAAVVALLFAVAVAASALPALRASRVDVVRALRL
jgi:putative ABC transport system permease protein